MAKNDNIIDFLGDVADAIREKKGTTEPIAAQDFSSEIKSIETDGMRYFDVRGFDADEFWTFGSLWKIYFNTWIVAPAATMGCSDLPSIGAIAIDNRKINIFEGGTLVPILDWAKNAGFDFEATYPEITEEEFYDLTWEAPELSVD